MLRVLPLDYKFSAPARLVIFILASFLFFSSRKVLLEEQMCCLRCFENIDPQADVSFSPFEDQIWDVSTSSFSSFCIFQKRRWPA
jgi:hypothetical protein